MNAFKAFADCKKYGNPSLFNIGAKLYTRYVPILDHIFNGQEKAHTKILTMGAITTISRTNYNPFTTLSPSHFVPVFMFF